MTNLISSGIQDWIKQFGVNANTLLLIIAIGGAGYAYSQSTQGIVGSVNKVDARIDRLTDKVDVNDSASLKRWAEHLDFHKDRNVAIASEASRTNERLNTLETAQRKIDELTYKQAQTDSNVSNIQQGLKEVQTTVNNQSTNISVMTEILKRIEQSLKESRPSATR